MITFDIITLFPGLFKEHLNNLPFKRALENKSAEINLYNLRDYAIDKHGTVDDKPYGGGMGMVLRPEPIFNNVNKILKTNLSTKKKRKIIVLSPRGNKFTQKKAQDYSKLEHLILICGRYEGMDHRVEEHLADELISIGDYVLSGGELPALVVMESIMRLLPGVLDADVTQLDSFSKGIIEHPQYTRPENHKGMRVPKVLLSGNHKEIEKWKREHSKKVGCN